MAIGLALVAGALTLLSQGGRTFTLLNLRMDLQIGGRTVQNGLTSELRRSALTTVTIVQTPSAIAFRVQDPQSTSMQQFLPEPRFVVYWHDVGARRVLRKVWPVGSDIVLNPDPLATNTRLTEAQLRQVTGSRNGSERVLSQNVERFSFNPPVFPPVPLQPTRTLRVEISLQAQFSNQVLTESAASNVTMRNRP